MKRTVRLLAAGLVLLAGTTTMAQSPYPNKPIRLVIGFAPGGAADVVARSMSDALGKAIGQTVIVENKPGNGSSIAAELVARAPADGHTLLIASPSSISVNPALNPKLGYKPADLLPVTRITSSPLVLAITPALGIDSVQALIDYAKKSPGKLNYGTSGNGSAPHLGAALFGLLTGTEMVHVPYRGGSLAIQSVMANETQLTFGTSPTVMPMVGDRLRALAVSTQERSPLLPELPGMREAGLPKYNLDFWYGVFVPAATPAPIVRKVFEATTTAMQQASVKAALARDGTEVLLSESPKAFADWLVGDSKFWVDLVHAANVKVD